MKNEERREEEQMGGRLGLQPGVESGPLANRQGNMNQGAYNPVMGSGERTYEGGAFEPSFPNGRGSGTLSVSAVSLRFAGKAGVLELPLAGLTVSLGGASDRIIFFKHPSRPDTTLHTPDHAILKEEAFIHYPELTPQIAKVHGKKRGNLAVFLGIILAIMALVGGIIAARDPMVNVVVDRIPPEWEVKMGETVFSSMTSQNPPLEDAALEKHLDALTAPLLRGIGPQPYPFKFHIIEDDTINAFALPGGHVVIHSELILKAESPEEVAGVLAHEIAHVTKRHSVRNVVKSTGTYFVFRVFLGDVSDLVGTLVRNGRYLLNQKYSRDYEREADETGWGYLIAADVNPRGMITFFEKLAAEQGDGTVAAVQESLAFMSTHPATSERIARLEEKAKALPKGKVYQGFDLNFKEFQDSLRAKIKAGEKSATTKPKPGGDQ
jgi:beta-barrel assembly-enhancing protease